jgi:hypothetical protein
MRQRYLGKSKMTFSPPIDDTDMEDNHRFSMFSRAQRLRLSRGFSLTAG